MSWTSITWYHMSNVTDRGQAQSTMDIVSDTNRRDVSEMLDLLALADTPFINRVGWGPESGGTRIEWLSEDIGPGYIKAVADVGTGASQFICASLDHMTTTESQKQISKGAVLYHFSSTDNEHGLIAVLSVWSAGTVDFEFVTSPAVSSYETTILAGDQLWIIGNAAGEASRPQDGRPFNRVVNTNEFTILRRDVQISGSMKETDMYAIGREDRHQILMRMKEMQRERERMALYSPGAVRTGSTTSHEPGLMKGVYGFMIAYTGNNNVDNSTRTLTETKFNTVVDAVWNYGGGNLTVYGSSTQIAKFTQWDKHRIRMAPRDDRGGGYVRFFMTEVGEEVELVPMRNVPGNLLFVLDNSRIKLRAKKNRKALLEKLGKAGDMDDWQLLSEFSMEMKGYNLGQHGMFTALA